MEHSESSLEGLTRVVALKATGHVLLLLLKRAEKESWSAVLQQRQRSIISPPQLSPSSPPNLLGLALLYHNYLQRRQVPGLLAPNRGEHQAFVVPPVVVLMQLQHENTCYVLLLLRRVVPTKEGGKRGYIHILKKNLQFEFGLFMSF